MNALKLADIFEKDGDGCICNAYASFECACDAQWADGYFMEASTELRRLHDQNKRLLEALEDLYNVALSSSSELSFDHYGMKNARAAISAAEVK